MIDLNRCYCCVQVQAPFEVRSRQEEENVVDVDRSFTCSCYHGVVPASGSMKVNSTILSPTRSEMLTSIFDS